MGFTYIIFWGHSSDFPVLCAFSGVWGFSGEPEFNAELDVLAEMGQYFPIWLQCKTIKHLRLYINLQFSSNPTTLSLQALAINELKDQVFTSNYTR